MSTCVDCGSSATTAESPQPLSVPSTAAAPPDPALVPSTFVPPVLNEGAPQEELPRVVVEFCDRCRWLHRAVWVQTELFLTFPPSADVGASPGIKAITLLPRNAPETGGRFRVWLLRKDGGVETERQESWRGWDLVWDRKIEGGFPELKVLKQRIRNLVAPSQHLGHSDAPAAPASSQPAPSPAATAALPPATAELASLGGATAVEAVGGVEEKASMAPEKKQEGERKEGELRWEDFQPKYRC